jgi:argininosuccinate lyase
MNDCKKRLNVLPLGAAALAGTGLPIDRLRTAELLNFPEVSKNSMDTVADRDYIAEFIFAASLSMAHLSRFCEDLIIWSSDEFGYAEISDAYTTGSSIMPQKKNPDIAELIRGKSARVYGDLFAILTLIKGLPMTYNRDLQEDKEPLFDAVDTIKDCLSIFTEMLAHTRFNAGKMYDAASGGYSTATDVAEYLVEKGVPFRRAHEIVGSIVAHCIRNKKALEDLTLGEFQNFYAGFDASIASRIQLENAVNARKSHGGTAREAVKERIREFEKTLGRK